jgi:hypothetical protein
MSDFSTLFARRKRPLVINADLPDVKRMGMRTVERGINGDIQRGTINGGLYRGKTTEMAPSGRNNLKVEPSAFFNFSKPRIPTQPTVAQRGPDAAPRPGALVVPENALGRQVALRAPEPQGSLTPRSDSVRGSSAAADMVVPGVGPMMIGAAMAAGAASGAEQRAASLNGGTTGSMPDGSTLVVRPDGSRSITGIYGSGTSRFDAAPAAATAGIYNEDGSKFVSERQRFADTLAGVKAGVNKRVAAMAQSAEDAQRRIPAASLPVAKILDGKPAPAPASDAGPTNSANAPDPSTIDAALAGVAADKAYRGRNTLLEGMPKPVPSSPSTGVEQPARGSEEERDMMERLSLSMRSIPLTPTENARIGYGALGRPGGNRRSPLGIANAGGMDGLTSGMMDRTKDVPAADSDVERRRRMLNASL